MHTYIAPNQQVNCRHIKITYLLTAPEPARGYNSDRLHIKYTSSTVHTLQVILPPTLQRQTTITPR